MNAESQNPSPDAHESAETLTTPGALAPMPQAGSSAPSRKTVRAVSIVAVLALLLNVWLWLRMTPVMGQSSSVQEAKIVANQAQEQVREMANKLATMEAHLNEATLQRSQLEELMQSLSRSRDENLVADIDAAIRLAQQQAQLSGSVEPLLAALKSAQTRLARMAQPRLAPLQRAIARDLGRIKASTAPDTPALLLKLDEVLRLADELPLANAMAPVAATPTPSLKPRRDDSVRTWWQRSQQVLGDEMRNLVRVSRIEQPEAALLSPEQSVFLRENFKLRLLNARQGLISRQFDASRVDLEAASVLLNKYFAAASRRVQLAASTLRQVQGQMKTLEIPQVDETLAVLATSAAGR